MYRRRLGRAILLGLELLVAADIIETVAVRPTFTSAGVLAIIVLIRTFLSMSLEVELEGVGPGSPSMSPPRLVAEPAVARRRRTTEPVAGGWECRSTAALVGFGGCEVVTHAVARSVQAAHHGSCGYLEETCSLGVGEPVDVDEFDSASGAVGQLAKPALHDLVEHRVDDDVLGRVCDPAAGGQFLVRVVEEIRLSSPVRAGVGVTEDGEEPRPGVAPVEAVERTCGRSRVSCTRSSAVADWW